MELDESLLKEIDLEFKRLSETTDIIIDGILDRQQYESSSIHIAWVLPQAIEYTQDRCYSNFLKNKSQTEGDDHIWGSPTWRRWAEVNYGLLHTATFEETRNASSKDLVGALFNSALIEIQKEPGLSSTPTREVTRGFAAYRDLIRKQVAAYKPDLIIVTGRDAFLDSYIAPMIEDATSLKKEKIPWKHERQGRADVAYFCSNHIAWLWAYHPSYRILTEKDYFETIINAYHKCQRKDIENV